MLGVVGEEAWVDGEGGAFVVGDEVGLLEESAAEGVLGVVGCAADGEVVRCFVDVRVVGSELQVEGGVGELDCDGAGPGDVRAQLESEGSVSAEQGVVGGVVDEVEAGEGVVGETERLFEHLACGLREPDLWDPGVDEGEDGVREEADGDAGVVETVDGDALQADNKVARDVASEGEGAISVREAGSVVAAKGETARDLVFF